jgi:hypothetical protein
MRRRPRRVTPAGRCSSEYVRVCTHVYERLTPLYILRYYATQARSSLVDPASNHMLVSKTKPCKSQYKPN